MRTGTVAVWSVNPKAGARPYTEQALSECLLNELVIPDHGLPLPRSEHQPWVSLKAHLLRKIFPYLISF